MEKNEIAESIDHGVGQFAAEASAAVDDVSLLFDVKDYPEEMHELIIECNRRIDEANSKYRIAKFREDMFAKGMKAGMYFCTFDRDENMLSFEFNEETRQMLGYDGLEDLPNEFESWVKTLVPEERDAIVKLFWDSVRIHRDLPDITHATYRMQKKDGGIIWVTGAGRFIRRPDDGSLEIYMGCYRDITAQQELEEYLKIIEALGKVFNFSLFIDVTDMSYRMISTNEYVEAVPKDPDAIVFLRNNVAASVAESFRQRLYDWLDKDAILASIEKHGSTSMEFYSESAHRWFDGIFMVGDRNEDGSIAHIVYGCQDTTDAKLQSLAQQKKISEFETEIYLDSLSQIHNRKFLDEKLVYEPCQAVVMADIDLFKEFNDGYGHELGDRVLVAFVEAVRKCTRTSDYVIRWGGDEFIVILQGISRKALASTVDKILNSVREIHVDGLPKEHVITTSVGCSYFEASDQHSREVIGRADAALYRAKANGRDAWAR